MGLGDSVVDGACSEFSVSLDNRLLARLDRAVAHYGQSRNDIVTDALTEWLNAEGFSKVIVRERRANPVFAEAGARMARSRKTAAEARKRAKKAFETEVTA